MLTSSMLRTGNGFRAVGALFGGDIGVFGGGVERFEGACIGRDVAAEAMVSDAIRDAVLPQVCEEAGDCT